MVKKYVLTTLLALGTLYATSQSLLEQRQARQSGQTPPKQEVVSPSSLGRTVPDSPLITKPQEPLEEIINLGTIRVSDVVTNFTVEIPDPYGDVDKDPVQFFYFGSNIDRSTGKKISYLTHVSDEIWRLDGELEGLALGNNYFKATFFNDYLSTTYAFQITTTNESPVPGVLDFVLTSYRDGGSLDGSASPILVDNNFVYNLGEFHSSYVLTNLTLRVTDPDNNLVRQSAFMETNGVKVGTFDYVNDSTFSFTTDVSQNRGPGTYISTATFSDEVGASATVNIYHTIKAIQPKVRRTSINTSSGIETNIDLFPEDKPDESSRRDRRNK